MAESTKIVYDDGVDRIEYLGGIRKITIDWQSTAGGAATITTDKIVGMLIKAVTNPGSAAPTANYDIALKDEEELDILTNSQSTLANRHTTSTEEVYFFEKNADATPTATGVHPVICDRIKVEITNAGDTKNGRIVLYYAPL